MEISIVDRNKCLTDEIRDFARRRLLFALSRFDSRIDVVAVVVSDANGPKGGIDQLCKLKIKMPGERDILIATEDADIKVCLARAAARAGRTVARRLSRNLDVNRHRRRAAQGPLG